MFCVCLIILSEGTPYGTIATVFATDEDSGQNAIIRYSFVNPTVGFYIDDSTGSISANRSLVSASHMQAVSTLFSLFCNYLIQDLSKYFCTLST